MFVKIVGQPLTGDMVEVEGRTVLLKYAQPPLSQHFYPEHDHCVQSRVSSDKNARAEWHCSSGSQPLGPLQGDRNLVCIIANASVLVIIDVFIGWWVCLVSASTWSHYSLPGLGPVKQEMLSSHHRPVSNLLVHYTYNCEPCHFQLLGNNIHLVTYSIWFFRMFLSVDHGLHVL